MLDRIKSYFPVVILAEALIIVLLCWYIWGTSQYKQHSNVLPSNDSMISKVTVTVYVPIKGLNKEQAHDAGLIATDVKKDDDKAVLASGQVDDDSGKRNVAAVIDIKTGETQLVEKREFAEKMQRYEIGLGYGVESGDLAKVIQFRSTVFRAGNFYITGQAEGFIVDRIENRHPWNAIALLTFRF